MSKTVGIIRAIEDPRLIGGGPISTAQETLLRAIYGLKLDAEQTEIFKRATGRSEYTPRVYRDISALAGRRSGKSTRIAANLAIYEAAITPHSIPATERASVVIIAPTEKQARQTFGVILAKMQASPTLSKLIANVRSGQSESEIALCNRIDIAVISANARYVRGGNVICVILEEGCFFRDSETGAYNLAEIMRAIIPAMLTFPDAKLIRVSSPWAKSGPMWDDYRLRDERPETLQWKLPSWEMNPALPQSELDKERVRDEAYFLREFGCEFVDAIEAFLPSADVDVAIRAGVREVPAVQTVKYFASCDASGLGGRDRFCFMVGHLAVKGSATAGLSLDCIRSWSKQNVSTVLDEISLLLRAYRASEIVGDQFGAAFLGELFRERGISMRTLPFTVRSKGDVFLGLKTDLAQRRIQLLDNPQLRHELVFLECRRTSGGHFSIAAPRSEHDDAACCLALLNYSVRESASTDRDCFAYLSIGGVGRRF